MKIKFLHDSIQLSYYHFISIFPLSPPHLTTRMTSNLLQLDALVAVVVVVVLVLVISVLIVVVYLAVVVRTYFFDFFYIFSR